MDWEKLAEAKIREWQARSPAQRVQPQLAGPVEPLEVQLLKEALHWRALAQNTPTGAERSQFARRAAEAETRLLVLLESSGRPLAARRIADMLAGVPRT